MITRLLGAGLVVVLLLGGDDVALASEVETVTLETCKTVYDNHMKLAVMPPAPRWVTKQVCKPIQLVVGKSNKLFDLRVSLSTTSGQPLANQQVQLKINHGYCAPHHLAKYRDLALSPRIITAICRLYPDSDFGLNKDLLARWQGSLTDTTDSDGKVTFDKLFFRFEPPQGTELAVVIPKSVENDVDEILKLFPIVTSMQIVSARYYGIIAPPKSQWHLHYNRDIPARAEVRWRVSSFEDPSSAQVTGRFSTTEASRELLITTEGFVCDGGNDNSNHLLQVMITPPPTRQYSYLGLAQQRFHYREKPLPPPPLLQDISSVDSVLVRSEKCRKI